MSEEYPESIETTQKKLTNKQKVFVAEYLRDFNATRAAIDAGYSEKTAAVIGSENLRKPNISQAISDAIAERAMKADEVLLGLADIARGDMGDFLSIGPMGFSVDLYDARERGLTHLIKKVKMRTTTTVNKDGVETETHDIELELYDKLAAYVNLGKHHGLFVDRTDITSKGEQIKGYVNVSPDDWDE